MIRRNTDERLRRLERAASQGDLDARDRLAYELLRAGAVTPPSHQLDLSPDRDPAEEALLLSAIEELAWSRIENWEEDRVPIGLLGESLAFAVHVLDREWRVDPARVHDDLELVFNGDPLDPAMPRLPSQAEAIALLERLVPCRLRRQRLRGAWAGLPPEAKQRFVYHFGSWVERDLSGELPCVSMNRPKKHRSNNTDRELRNLERMVSTSDDPALRAQLAVARVRAGVGLGAWYAEHVAPLGIPEEDFKAMLATLARDGRWVVDPKPRAVDRIFQDTKDWAWLATLSPDWTFRANVLAVRPSTGDWYQPVLGDVVTVGTAAGRQARRTLFRADLHPREAWPELASTGEVTGDIPLAHYDFFENHFGAPGEEVNHDGRGTQDTLPSCVRNRMEWHVTRRRRAWRVERDGGQTTEFFGSYGLYRRIADRSPDINSRQAVMKAMFAWAGRASPDRTSFHVMDVRAYVGLDPITGWPPGVTTARHASRPKKRNSDADIRELERQASTGDPAAQTRLRVALHRAGQSYTPFEPPAVLSTVIHRDGFTAETHGARSGTQTLWRPSSVLRISHEGTLINVKHGKFFQMIEPVAWAYYKVKGYRWPVITFWHELTGERIA